MTQTVPATAVLGAGKTGLSIGYRVLNLDGTEYSAWTTAGVAETSVAGTYRAAGGVVVPDAGGYIVWGESGTDYAEATVESAAVPVTLASTQPAVTFGQVKILADVASQGALHVENSNASGIGQYNSGQFQGQYNIGGLQGQYNLGGETGQENYGLSEYGQHNQGAVSAVSGVDATGIRAAAGLAAANLDTQLATVDGNVDAILEDTGTSGVLLAGTQGPVTFGQVKILANVANEGALHIENSHPGGTGQWVQGGEAGQLNYGTEVGAAGQVNKGLQGPGQMNDGNPTGQYNVGNPFAVSGMDAINTRAAIGLAAANLDTQLAAVAKTGADGDTLETLSVQLDAIVPLTAQETRDAMKLAPTAGTPDADSIDEHLDDILEDTGTTIPATLATLATAADLATVDANVDAIKMITDDLDTTAVTQVAASSAGHLVITAGLTFEESVSGLVIPADWTKAYWTLKSNEADADTLATIQLRVSNPSSLTDGLQRLNGAALVTPITAASGALTVDQLNGRITINLADEVTILLSRAGSVKSKIGALGWDVKFISSGSSESVGRRGTAAIVLTETKAIL